MEKVSIIVPCYNGEKFIDRCISSIYFQTYPAIELIVVDDGSVDNSKRKILKWVPDFKEKGYNLKYYYQENGGLGSAINAGLKLVSGDYISLLDADDEYLQNAVKERVEYLQKHENVEVVRTNGWVVREKTRFLFITEMEEKERKDIFLALLRGETNNWAGSFMVRTKALFNFYPDREIYQSRYGQNLQFLLPLIYKKECGFIDKAHMNYIQIGNSLCRTDKREEMQRRSLENAEGYKDIRVHMLNLIVQNEAEKKYYLNEIEAGYWKSIMKIAINDKNLMKQAYMEKLRCEQASLDDKILYCKTVSPIRAYIYRLFRKSKTVVSKFVIGTSGEK